MFYDTVIHCFNSTIGLIKTIWKKGDEKMILGRFNSTIGLIKTMNPKPDQPPMIRVSIPRLV